MPFLMSFSLSSCSAGVSSVDDTPEISVVVSNGAPYFVDGMVVCYYYNGWYYYQYLIGDRYYFHRYRSMLSLDEAMHFHKPIPPYYRRPPQAIKPVQDVIPGLMWMIIGLASEKAL